MNGAIYLNGSTLMTTPTEAVVSIARAAGFSGIEARAERLLRNPEEVRAAASVALPGEVLTVNGVSLTLRRDGTVDRELLHTDVEARLALCNEIGARWLLAVAPRVPGLRAHHAMIGIHNALELVLERAAVHNVRIAFEFLGFHDCPVNTPRLAGEAVEGFSSIGVVLDSCHWYASGSPPLDGFPVDRLAVVHVNDAPPKPLVEIEDSDRVLPGLGVIKLHELVRELRSRRYTGPWSLETFNPFYWRDDPAAVAGAGAAAMTRLLEEDRTSEARA